MANEWLLVAVTAAAAILAMMDSARRPAETRRRIPDAERDGRHDLRARADAIITYLTGH